VNQGDWLQVTDEGEKRYGWKTQDTFEVLSLDERGNPLCALLNPDGTRHKRSNGRECHVQFPKQYMTEKEPDDYPEGLFDVE
jgi:hypothetical protein